LSKQHYACSDATSAKKYPPPQHANAPFLGAYSAYLPLGEKKHKNIFLFNYCLAIAFAERFIYLP